MYDAIASNTCHIAKIFYIHNICIPLLEESLEKYYPAIHARNKTKDLNALEDWLKSYEFDELFDKIKEFDNKIMSIVLKGNLKIGMDRHTFGGEDATLTFSIFAYKIKKYIGAYTVALS